MIYKILNKHIDVSKIVAIEEPQYDGYFSHTYIHFQLMDHPIKVEQHVYGQEFNPLTNRWEHRKADGTFSEFPIYDKKESYQHVQFEQEINKLIEVWTQVSQKTTDK